MMKKQNKGITLIALVITIIVLLILVGVTIVSITGNNGILTKAGDAKEKNEFSEVKESMKLTGTEHTAYLYDNNVDVDSKMNFKEWLKSKGYLDDNDTLDMEKITNKELSTGKGDSAGTIDVYKLKQELDSEETTEPDEWSDPEFNIMYKVIYYDKSGNETLIDTIKPKESSGLTKLEEGYFTITADGTLDFIDKYAYRAAVAPVQYPSETLEIPETVKGIKVKSLDYWMTKGIYGVKKIKISAQVEEITYGVFANLSELEQVELPESLKCLEMYSFSDDTNLSSIILPKNLETIRQNAFGNCTSLKTITIPKSVNDIDVNLNWGIPIFDGCTNLTEVNIEQGSPLLVDGKVTSELAQKLGVSIDKIHVK